MDTCKITEQLIKDYQKALNDQEKGRLTQEKYVRDLQNFRRFLGDSELIKAQVIRFKEKLLSQYAVNSVNSMLSAVNHFFEYAGWHHLKVKQVKQQHQVYCREEKELTKEEYYRLIQAAQENSNQRLGLLMQAICSTGIRISELHYITVEAVKDRAAMVGCKGKIRKVFLPKKLTVILLQYAKKNHILRGPVFVTKQGKPLNRSNIWREMKKICRKAGVEQSKVFPHNLRHLFAKIYYSMEKDIAKLADLLGHSNINTTRIYIMTSGTEHRKQIDRLALVI